ncbi:MAG: helix-hairpin-helix domain-containing protein [Bacteroidales bacterium]|nr:helix-hairpin-helix domain-containing protein [Bacteroidales bacterium]
MRKLAFILSFLLAVQSVLAQDVMRGIEDLLEQMQGEETGASPESLVQWYEDLLRNPLNINAATRSQLEQLQVLSLFQIESLLEYREEYGDILSLTELAAVDGFGKEMVDALSPFIILGAGEAEGAGTYSEVRSRVKWKTSQEGLYRYARYLGGAGRFSYGATFESDAQESLFPDFISAHLKYDAGRFKLLLGDFTASYGQGLAMDKSFSMSALGSPAAILKRRNDFRAYTSSGENDALRGLAASLDLGSRGRLQAFFSAASLDATVTDSTYSSLPATGYHRTDFQKAQKNALHEFVGCVNYTFETDVLQLSLTATAYGYDRKNARRVQEYNRFQMYDGLFGNIALSALYSTGHCRIYAESALDRRGTPAALAGTLWSPGYGFEASVQLRYYPKEYIANHAGAYSSLSTVSNQYGFLANILARPADGLTITAMCDAAYHPHVRYRIDTPSFVAKVKARCEYAADSWSASLQDNYAFKDYEDSHRHLLKLSAVLRPSSRLSLSGRGDCVLLFAGDKAQDRRGYRLERGLGASLGIDWRAAERLALWGGAAYFDSPSSSTRIYACEKDLPQSFSVVSYGGRGVAASLLATADLFRGFRMTLKTVYTRYFEEGKDNVLEIRGQIDWAF